MLELGQRRELLAAHGMIGTKISDFLRIIRVLGEGGMGIVYLAVHEILNDLQAVKVLDPALSRNPQIVTRFLNEGRAAVKLRHPNLVQVFDVGQLPNNGAWYMVMEYLDGGTLAGFIASQGGPLSVYLTLHILAPGLSCMQWIHDQQVVHRDLKPENLFLVQHKDDPHFLKVLDLGVAQVSEAIATGPRTQQGTVIGTPVYMAPEQLRGEHVTAAADIFALGTIIYEMSTGGWFPWQRDDEPRVAYCDLPATELYHRQRSTAPIDPRRRFSGISDGWALACLRVLDHDPGKRPQTARELALLFAEQAPGDELHEDGLAILKQRAPDLLLTNYARDTIRAPRRAPVPPPASGAKLRYQLGVKLGDGGMAEVFEGRLLGAEGFERRVAIKRVLAGLSEKPEFVTMFVAEAQIASRLNHINVVSVIDFDRDADNRLCLVMEYVHGKDLATLLEAGPIAPSLMIYIVVEMLRGLGYAHAPEPGREGIVHRDVSPQNLMLSYEGAVKVSDFGIAKARSASGNAYSGTVRGKVSYMSPEQCSADLLDARSDLFAVGVMMYEMLTQRPLFTGTTHEIIGQILHKTIAPPSRIRSRIPRDVDEITMKLLARNRDDRYANAEAAITDLLSCDGAPRDGRGELVQALAQRFPHHALRTRLHDGATPASGRALHAAQMPAVNSEPRITRTAPPEGAIPEPTFAATGGPSTLSGSASESIKAARPWVKRRWMRPASIAVCVAVVGAVIAVLTIRRDSESVMVNAGSRDSIPVASPVDSPAVAPVDGRISVTTDAGISMQGAAPNDASRNEVAAPASSPPPQPLTRVHDARDATSDRSSTDASGSSSRAVPPTRARTRDEVGQLIISVTPWALIELNGKSAGQTPFNDKLPAGRYRVRIMNDDLGKDETVVVVVSPAAPATVQRKW